MPPAANLHSQLIRVCVSEPSSLSNLPEMFDRKIRFLTVRLRNLSGVKMRSSVMIGVRSWCLAGRRRGDGPFPHHAQQGRNERGRRTLRPGPRHQFDVAAGGARARGVELEDDERSRTHRAGDRWRPAWSPGAARSAARTCTVRPRRRPAAVRQRGSLHSSRMRSKPRTRLCTAMPVACTPARSSLTRSASSRRERCSRPLS